MRARGDVSEIGISVDPRTGDVRFETDMTNVYSEVSYDRPKGPKVLSRVPQKHVDVSFDAPEALEKNFDFLCAVDTNTRGIRGKNVSMVGVVAFQAVWVPEEAGLTKYWQFDVPFCLEYVEIKSAPENFGWLAALERLRIQDLINGALRVGMVVDSDLGNIADYNHRKRPVDGSDYLPANVQLVYATGDAGKDNILNKALSLADSVASQTLRAIEDGSMPFNTRPTAVKSG